MGDFTARLKAFETGFYGLEPELANKYSFNLTQHIEFVIEAGKRVGAAQALLTFHDMSKWEEEEFVPYARYFGTEERTAEVRAEFDIAWNRHIHKNPHHPEYWVTPDVRLGQLQFILNPMPDFYVREMVADWLGASRIYTGSWEMSAWLRKELPKKRLLMHPQTQTATARVLLEIGYGDILRTTGFGLDTLTGPISK